VITVKVARLCRLDRPAYCALERQVSRGRRHCRADANQVCRRVSRAGALLSRRERRFCQADALARAARRVRWRKVASHSRWRSQFAATRRLSRRLRCSFSATRSASRWRASATPRAACTSSRSGSSSHPLRPLKSVPQSSSTRSKWRRRPRSIRLSPLVRANSVQLPPDAGALLLTEGVSVRQMKLTLRELEAYFEDCVEKHEFAERFVVTLRARDLIPSPDNWTTFVPKLRRLREGTTPPAAAAAANPPPQRFPAIVRAIQTGKRRRMSRLRSNFRN
jgi:hypothetical protein